jgi:nitroreductase/NAD-dependent dihydropyrimidine dehydrogenase PreA subunit
VSLLTIDADKCRQDGLCAADCPMGIIGFEPGRCPEMVPGGEAVCLRCGHCVAVCPHGALDHGQVPLAQAPAIDPALALTPAQGEQFLRTRRSVRHFKKEPLDRRTLERLIALASHAPTAGNSQLVEWTVIDDPRRLRAISARVIDWMRALLADPAAKIMPYYPLLVKAWDAGRDTILHGAPCLVTAMAPPAARNGMVDLTLALSYLELAAPLHRLGTCWAGLLQGAMLADPATKAAVGIPPQYPAHYPMMIGRPAVRYHRLPPRRAPRIHWPAE